MQQIGCPTVTGQMRLHGQIDHKFFTCPICKVAVSRCKNRLIGHLNHHVKEGTIPKNHVGYIGLIVENKRGINARIAALPEDQRVYVTEFVKKMRDASYIRTETAHLRVRF